MELFCCILLIFSLLRYYADDTSICRMSTLNLGILIRKPMEQLFFDLILYTVFYKKQLFMKHEAQSGKN